MLGPYNVCTVRPWPWVKVLSLRSKGILSSLWRPCRIAEWHPIFDPTSSPFSSTRHRRLFPRPNTVAFFLDCLRRIYTSLLSLQITISPHISPSFSPTPSLQLSPPSTTLLSLLITISPHISPSFSPTPSQRLSPPSTTLLSLLNNILSKLLSDSFP